MPPPYNRHLGPLLVRSVPSWSSSCGWGWVSKPRPAPQSSPVSAAGALRGVPHHLYRDGEYRAQLDICPRCGARCSAGGWGKQSGVRDSSGPLSKHLCLLPTQISVTSSSELTCTRPEGCWQQMTVGFRTPLLESSSLPSARPHG